MPELGQVDLTVTSPPYDNLRKYNGYEFDFEGIAQCLYRMTKTGGVVVWVVGDATINGSETGTSFRQALYFKEIGFNLHDTMIYQKAQACFGSNNCYLQAFEYMFILSKTKPKTINFIRDRKNKRSGKEKIAVKGLKKDGTKSKRTIKKLKQFSKRKNIWGYGVGGSNIEHPAIFPTALAYDHIYSWSNEGDTVFDPMAGSGTTLKMAEKLKRKWIGCEISEAYCEIIARRLEQERAQLKLF